MTTASIGVTGCPHAAAAAHAAATRLTAVPVLAQDEQWRRESLWLGLTGVALLHIERARAGVGDWQTAHAWVTAATANPLSAALSSGLHSGVTALAFVLHSAGEGRYPLTDLDRHVTALTHRRLDQATERLAAGHPATFAEYDLLHGLTGIGTHLLRHRPHADVTGRLLQYVVRLAMTVNDDGRPAWWVNHGPDRGRPLPAGHANLGIAHGITGPLALLAHAYRNQITVENHRDALHRLSGWLTGLRRFDDHRVWWPQWITVDGPAPVRPGRPSWCYGTPGISRTLQVTGIALRDRSLQQMAEQAMAGCLAGPAGITGLTEQGLCHGTAGLYQTIFRAAQDADDDGALAACLPALAARLSCPTPGEGDWLLEGSAGTALALHTAAYGTPISDWDACLALI